MRERQQAEGACTSRERPSGGGVGEVLWLWGMAFGGLVLAKRLGIVWPWLGQNVKAVAAGLFLYLPTWKIRRRGEELEAYGIPDLPWRSPAAASQFRKDLAWGLGTFAVLVPCVVVGFLAILFVLPHLPPWLRWWIPYQGAAPDAAWRLPPQMWLLTLDQLLVVALPEELFFRGYVQTRLRRIWGEGRLRLWGVGMGPYFWVTQGLFALAHLGDFDPSRLSVFLPSILFGWLRERTGSIGAPILVHGGSNLLLQVLEASFV